MTSTQELVARARAEAVNDAGDPEAYWALVNELRDRDPAEVWAAIVPLAEDPDVRVQVLVPDVLRGLGREAQPLADQTLALFAHLLARAPRTELLAAIASACVQFHDVSVVTMLTPHAGHQDAAVREAVLHAVRRSAHPDAIAALISLSNDPEDELREWATFALGSQRPLIDGPDLREALAARLTDRSEAVRDEAIVGLGLRGDRRALGPLRAQLERGFGGEALFQAAQGLASAVLLPALAAMKPEQFTEQEQAELAAAIAACSAGQSQ